MLRITLRDRLELTLARTRVGVDDLARLTGINAEVFDRVFRGITPSFTASQLVTVATTLHCAPEWLLGLSDERPNFRAARHAVAASRAAAEPPRPRRPSHGIRSVPLSSFGIPRSSTPRREARLGGLAARLTAHLEERGISRGALARAAAIPRQRLDDLAAGRQTDLNIEDFAALVRASGRSVAWWFPTDTPTHDAT